MQIQRLPTPSPLPMLSAIGLAGLFILPTFQLYIPAMVSGAFAAVFVLGWLWTGTNEIPEAPTKDAGRGVILPLIATGPSSIGWWAVFITMVGSSTAFASLVFAYFYYWTIHPVWPPAGTPKMGAFWPLVAAVAAAAHWAMMLLARWATDRSRLGIARIALLLAAVYAALSAAALLLGPWRDGLDPTLHAYPATIWVLSGWSAAHLLLSVVGALYCLARSLAGRLTAEHDGDLWNATLFAHFTVPTVLATLAVIHLFPGSGGSP